MVRLILLACALTIGLAQSSPAPVPDNAPVELVDWHRGLASSDRTKFENAFEPNWFNGLSTRAQAAYVKVVYDLHDFLDSGADSHPQDNYVGFEPLLLRTSFHSSGTFHHKSGTGGSNGGTIFQKGELEDPENTCIDTATEKLQELLGSQHVPLADCVVIAGIVALDRMEFPRMDLLKMTGGRKDFKTGVAYRERLPSADDDPLKRFTEQMGFTLGELVALIGGSHNFGSAHGKCSGYEGQWTSNPLSWGGADGDMPEFFVELLRTDWRWYEVCTFHDNSVRYTSIPDPFAGGGEEEEEEEGGGVNYEEACEQAQSQTALICEEQAMRGCDFEDGSYPAGKFPCPGVIFRLKSDFWLKMNPALLPHAEAYAADASLFARDFGNAYHKLTHNGLTRCGMSGNGCGDDSVCDPTTDEDGNWLYEQCVKEEGDLSSAGWIGVGIAIMGGAVVVMGLLYALTRASATPSTSSSNTSSPPSTAGSVSKPAPMQGLPPQPMGSYGVVHAQLVASA